MNRPRIVTLIVTDDPIHAWHGDTPVISDDGHKRKKKFLYCYIYSVLLIVSNRVVYQPWDIRHYAGE